jgi:hypothetical protein
MDVCVSQESADQRQYFSAFVCCQTMPCAQACVHGRTTYGRFFTSVPTHLCAAFCRCNARCRSGCNSVVVSTNSPEPSPFGVSIHMKRTTLLAGLGLLCFSLCAFAGASYVGRIELVEQYAPGANGSGALCYVGVPASAVQSKAACASADSRYYYSWQCDDPRRKGFLALAMAAYLTERKVQLIGSGLCSPHPSYENLDYLIISENP